MPELAPILASGVLPLIDAHVIKAIGIIEYSGNLGVSLTSSEILLAFGGIPEERMTFVLKDTSGHAFLVIWDGTSYWYELLTEAT